MRLPSAVVAVVLIIGSPASLFGQVNYQLANAVRFDMPSPTARTMAMGGSGIGMPDDSSAVVMNPAAMRLLVRAEVSADFQFVQASVPFVSGGVVGRPASAAFPVNPLELQVADAPLVRSYGPFDTYAPDTHFAFVFPARKFAVGGYYRSTLHTSFGGAAVLRESPSTAGRFNLVQDEFTSSPLSVDTAEYGGAVSVSVRRSLSVGFSVAFEDLQSSSNDEIAIPESEVPNPFGTTFRTVVSTVGHDVALSYTAGVSWSPTPRINVGVTRHRGSSRSLTTVLFDSTPSGGNPELARQQTDLRFPDSTAFGIGIRLTETLRVLSDVRRVNYSQMTEGLAGFLLRPATDFRMDDATELRVGGEYVIPFGGKSLAVRAGLWRDPAHSLIYVGNDPQVGALFGELFNERIGDRVHKTLGTGFTAGRFGASVGIDVAPRYRALAASMAVRFR